MACTIRIASETAKFGQPEVKLGVCPAPAEHSGCLVWLAKAGACSSSLPAKSSVPGGLAHRSGQRSRSRANLISRAEAILKQIFSNAPVAIRYSLEAVTKGLETSLDEGLALEASFFGLCAGTEDKKEGTSAFLEKRAPQFRGR